MSVYWLVLALALKTGESAFIALGWRNILRAAYPDDPISFRTAWGASQGGTAINAVTPGGCRIGVNVIFIVAFSMSPLTVFLVAASHMLSGLFAITPGGVGQTQALDVATLTDYAPTQSIAAFSITHDAIITMWNIVLGVIVMVWAFGYTAAKDLIFRREKKPETPVSAS